MANRAVFFLLVVLTVAVGCGGSPYFSENRSIEDGKWAQDDAISFDFKIEDTETHYDFWLSLRNGSEYPYSNVFLFIKTDFPNGQTKVDTLECTLANSRGVWNGSGIGDMHSHNFAYLSNTRFPITGDYKLSVHQAMRLDPLSEIYDVGLKLEARE